MKELKLKKNSKSPVKNKCNLQWHNATKLNCLVVWIIILFVARVGIYNSCDYDIFILINQSAHTRVHQQLFFFVWLFLFDFSIFICFNFNQHFIFVRGSGETPPPPPCGQCHCCGVIKTIKVNCSEIVRAGGVCACRMHA